jgi:hypothetical protein
MSNVSELTKQLKEKFIQHLPKISQYKQPIVSIVETPTHISAPVFEPGISEFHSREMEKTQEDKIKKARKEEMEKARDDAKDALSFKLGVTKTEIEHTLLIHRSKREMTVIEKYEDIYGIWEKSNILYFSDGMIDTLCNLLSKFKEYRKWNGVLCSFLEQNEFLENVDGKFYMLSVEQVDKIFYSMKNISNNEQNYIIQHSLVKICSYPWKLDVQKYQSGLCYHGNFGDETRGVYAIGIIERNIKRFIGKISVDEYMNSETYQSYI